MCVAAISDAKKKITALECLFSVGPHVEAVPGREESKYFRPIWAQKAENSYSSCPFPTPALTRYVSFMSHVNYQSASLVLP